MARKLSPSNFSQAVTVGEVNLAAAGFGAGLALGIILACLTGALGNTRQLTVLRGIPETDAEVYERWAKQCEPGTLKPISASGGYECWGKPFSGASK